MSEEPISVYVVGGCDFSFVRLFRQYGWRKAYTMDKAKIILFTGGEDVTPAYYDEEKLSVTHNNPARDKFELGEYTKALTTDALIIGICRGGQFLNVMNGGKMWQDVDRHTRTHELVDLVSGQSIMVTSTHHQMMRPTSNAKIIATARESSRKVSSRRIWTPHGTFPGMYGGNDVIESNVQDSVDYEVVYYENTGCLCFQPHPEYLSVPTTAEYFYKVVNRILKQGEQTCAA